MIGGSVSIGTAGAANTIDNRISALLSNAGEIDTTSGDVVLSADETASINSNTFAAAGALGISIGGAVANATTVSKNSLTNVVRAGFDHTSVTSADNISVASQDTSNVDATILGIGATVGLVSLAVGATSATNTIGGSVLAAANAATLTANGSGDIALGATSNPTVASHNTVGAVQVGIGASAAGGGSSDTINNTTAATVSDSQITAVGDTVTVTANSTNRLAPQALSFSGGLVGIATLAADANIGGTTQSTLGGASTINAQSMSLTANSSNTATPSTTVGAGGAIGITAAGANATISRSTQALISGGADINIGTTNLSFNANSTSHADAVGLSVTAAAVSVLVMNLDTNVTTTNRAAQEANSVIRANGGAIRFHARDTSEAHTSLRSVGVGLLLNATATSPASNVTPTTTAEVLGDILGTTANTAAGSVTLTAQSNDKAETVLQGNNGGLVNVLIAQANAKSAPTTRARIGSNRTIRTSGDVILTSQATSEADASARSSAGGFVTISSNDAVAESSPTIISEVGSNAVISAGGWFALNADALTNRDFGARTLAESGDGYTTAAAASNSGGFVSVQDTDSTVVDNPRVFNLIGTDARISAGMISIFSSGAAADEVLTASGGGGFFASGGVDAALSRSATVSNDIGDRAVLIATGAITLNCAGLVRRLRRCPCECRRRSGLRLGGRDAAIESHGHEQLWRQCQRHRRQHVDGDGSDVFHRARQIRSQCRRTRLGHEVQQSRAALPERATTRASSSPGPPRRMFTTTRISRPIPSRSRASLAAARHAWKSQHRGRRRDGCGRRCQCGSV